MQAEAILNLRLRSLRRLEEMQIREEHAKLTREKRDLTTLLRDASRRWTQLASEIEEVRARFATSPRRTRIEAAPAEIAVTTEALVEREAVTVILSEKGWIRAVKGSIAEPAELRFKEGDRVKLLVPCETTDRLSLFATNGRAYTLKAADIPRGRGDGQPVRLIVELGNADDVVSLFLAREGTRFLLASRSGRGFIVRAEDLLAEKRTGRQVLNLRPNDEAAFAIPVEGDHVAALGSNRRLLVFPLNEVPELARGSGVILQRYRDGALATLKVFALAEGLTWRTGTRRRTDTDLSPWTGTRGQTGHAAKPGTLE
jgi:topoisomerase-4 subunit A